MKRIKYIVSSICLFCLPLNVSAQITDWIVQQIVENVVGSIIDGIAESIGRSEGEQATREFTRSLEGTPSSVNINMYSAILQNSVENAPQIAYTALAEKSTGMKYSKSIALNDINNVYKGLFVDSNARNQVRNMLTINNSITDSLTDISRDANAYYQQIPLKICLTPDAYQIWNSVNKSEQMSFRLWYEMSNSIDLYSLFQAQPISLKTYYSLKECDLRTNVELLGYLTFEANRFGSIWDSLFVTSPLIKTINMEGLTVGGTHSLFLQTKKELCSITYNSVQAGFNLHVKNAGVLDLYPASCSTYEQSNKSWKTDNLGRPTMASLEISNKPSSIKIDKSKISNIQYIKQNYDVIGTRIPVDMKQNKKKTNFDLVPSNLGGEVSFINTVIVDKTVAKSSEMKRLDKKILKAVKKGTTVKRIVHLEYNDKSSFSPSSIVVEASWNGHTERCKVL